MTTTESVELALGGSHGIGYAVPTLYYIWWFVLKAATRCC
jgi:hypothetical protein